MISAQEQLVNDGTWHFIQSMPGEEGKWFATAKEAGLLDLAIELANRSPSEPRTLTRAARDFMDKNPAFALEAPAHYDRASQ